MRKLISILAAAAMVLSLAMVFAVAPVSAAGTVVYNNIPDPLPGNVPSVGYEATSTSEFGGQIQLAGKERANPTVTVLMSSWACETGNWYSHDCSTSPGATFDHPITLNIYNVNADDSPGALIATDTQTFTMPYRPSDTPDQCDSGWFDTVSQSCVHGLAFPISFDFTGVWLPEKVIIGVAYNTSHYGDNPIGTASCSSTSAGCPYDSLNVGTNPSPSVGTALPTAADAYLNSTWGGAYCDASLGTGTFRLDAGCWTGYLPAIEVQASAPQWKTFGTAAWRPHQGHESQHGLVTTSEVDENAPYGVTSGGIELLNGPTDPASITAASFDFKADQGGPSGGSPRLVIAFSDSGYTYLRPLTWEKNNWLTVDGFGANANDWDNVGGSCDFLYETTYAVASACHAGATITAIYLVNDSGWAYPATGETVVVDNITVNSIVAAGPGDSD